MSERFAAAMGRKMVSRASAEELGDFSTDDLVRVDGHLGCGGFAGADGPDRLIGDDDGHGGFRGAASEGAGDLGLEDGFCLAGFALGEDFADADDGPESVTVAVLGIQRKPRSMLYHVGPSSGAKKGSPTSTNSCRDAAGSARRTASY